MGIFGKMFSRSAPSSKGEAVAASSLEYKGYLIQGKPFKNAGQWQLAGEISKDGQVHKFIRADAFTDQKEAADLALSKGQLIVDQLGADMFK